MGNADPHVRWLLEVPNASEETLSDWLLEHGSSATYREADPPHVFYAYFPPGQKLPDPEHLSNFSGVRLIRVETFEDEDWLAKSREAFGSFDVGRRFHILPLWDANAGPTDRMTIRVNPGLAFGTGGHETTRLCMTLLEELAEAHRLEGCILDIGAGTGILSLAAAALGGREITAFDIDPDCGPAMEEFITMNVSLFSGNRPFDSFVGTLEDQRVNGPYQGLLANILLETIQELLPRMASIAAPGAWLVASGILAERQDEALLSLSMHGFKPQKVTQEGAWIAILAERLP